MELSWLFFVIFFLGPFYWLVHENYWLVHSLCWSSSQPLFGHVTQQPLLHPPPPLPTMRHSVAWPDQVMKEMNFESMPHTLDLNSKMFHSMSATLMYSLFKKRYMMEQNWRNVFIGKDLSCGHVAFAWQNEIVFGIFKTVATICVVFLWK